MTDDFFFPPNRNGEMAHVELLGDPHYENDVEYFLKKFYKALVSVTKESKA